MGMEAVQFLDNLGEISAECGRIPRSVLVGLSAAVYCAAVGRRLDVQ